MVDPSFEAEWPTHLGFVAFYDRSNKNFRFHLQEKLRPEVAQFGRKYANFELQRKNFWSEK